MSQRWLWGSLGIPAGGGDGGAVVASKWDVGAWSVRQAGSINTSNARRVSPSRTFVEPHNSACNRRADRLESLGSNQFNHQSNPVNMSDYEDEMDVDAPAADTSIVFSGDAKKGKRSAANLPVEAEDSLPWQVAYRIESKPG